LIKSREIIIRQKNDFKHPIEMTMNLFGSVDLSVGGGFWHTGAFLPEDLSIPPENISGGELDILDLVQFPPNI
jgi:hypothetical protein